MTMSNAIDAELDNDPGNLDAVSIDDSGGASGILDYLKCQPFYKNQIKHVEHVPSRAARYAALSPPALPNVLAEAAGAGRGATGPTVPAPGHSHRCFAQRQACGYFHFHGQRQVHDLQHSRHGKRAAGPTSHRTLSVPNKGSVLLLRRF